MTAVVSLSTRTSAVIHVTYTAFASCTTRIVTRWSPVPRTTRVTPTAIRAGLAAKVLVCTRSTPVTIQEVAISARFTTTAVGTSIACSLHTLDTIFL